MMSIRARKRLIAGETAAGRKIEKKSTFTPDSSETTRKIPKLFDAAFSPDKKKKNICKRADWAKIYVQSYIKHFNAIWSGHVL